MQNHGKGKSFLCWRRHMLLIVLNGINTKTRGQIQNKIYIDFTMSAVNGWIQGHCIFKWIYKHSKGQRITFYCKHAFCCYAFQIIFYEDRNFHGRNHESSGDCPDVTSYLSRCSSCRVESGCFMVYEQSDFMGHQILVRRGDYPDNQRLMGMSMSDCIRSCRMIPMVILDSYFLSKLMLIIELPNNNT